MISLSKKIAQGTKYLALIALLTSTFSVFGNVSSTSVESVAGYVTVTDENGKVRRLKDGDTIRPGETVNTGDNSSVTIRLSNGDSILLGKLQSYTLAKTSNSSGFASKSLGNGRKSDPLTGTTAGGAITNTTPGEGGSPIN